MDRRQSVSFGLLLLLYCFVSRSAGALRTYYLADLCSYSPVTSTIRVGSPDSGSFYSSGILKATSSKSYTSGETCSVHLDPGRRNYVLISIRRIDVRRDCIDTLTLSEGPVGKKIMYCSDYWDSDEWRDFQSMSKVTVNFTAAESNLPTFSGFELVFTAYHNAPCSSKEYQCENFRCVSKDLKCDGHNHCGDRSDQRNCKMTTGEIAGTLFGVIFLVAALLAGIAYCWGRNRGTIRIPYETMQQQQTSAYPPPNKANHPFTYQENHPPSFPGPSLFRMGNPINAGQH